MPLPRIETSRLELRPLAAGDVDDIHRLWVHPDVREYLWDDEVISKEQAASVVEESNALFREKGFGLWGAYAREDSPLIGFCGYWFFHDPPQLQLLYGVAPAHWGKGFATELAKAMIRYGFEEAAFDRVIAGTDAPNLASLRVMEKAGMTFDRRVFVNGLDTVYYTISREEFRADDSHFKVR